MTMMDEPEQIGRIALRREGKMWNAYWADEKTMDGAIFLGSINISLCEGNDAVRQAFIDLMRLALDGLFKDVLNIAPTWPDDPQRAPEHERAGHG